MWMRLEDICTVFTDGDWIESKDQADEGIRLIQTGNIGMGAYLEKEEKAKYISEETFNKLKCTEIFSGDILVSRLPEPVGRACIIPEKKERMITAVDCTICRSNEAIVCKEYLCYFMRSNAYYTRLLNSVTGTTRKRISRKNLGNVELDIPSKREQEKVVKQLDCLVKVISSRITELQRLDDLIKARFVEMFGHQSHNEKSLPYMTVDDVAEIYLGITHTPTYVDSGVMFISAKNTSGDFLDLTDVKYISREEFEGAPKGSKPQVNDVLFSRVGSNLGHPVILEEELELCTFVSLGFLRSKGIVTSNYLKHWMRDEFFAKQVSEHVKGGGQPNLNTGWLKEFKIIVPNLEKQKEFDDFCHQVTKSKVVVQKALDETQLLFDSLMQQYFG
jgi:type I restriction enzyme, S subunit